MSRATRKIEVDASAWSNESDFYDGLANALGSVEWHGRNADAFMETMIYYTDLNEEQPPYQLLICRLQSHLKPFARTFSSWVAEARQGRIEDPNWGDDVEVEVVIQ